MSTYIQPRLCYRLTDYYHATSLPTGIRMGDVMFLSLVVHSDSVIENEHFCVRLPAPGKHQTVYPFSLDQDGVIQLRGTMNG